MIEDDGLITPIQKVLDFYIERDDLFFIVGVSGGEARTCWNLLRYSSGAITAGSRHSPQVKIVSSIAKYLNIPCRVHVPQGQETDEIIQARENGAEVFKHFPGYNTVIIKRALEDYGERKGYTYVPFGMECPQAVEKTASQVANIPRDVKRIVVPVGSGMSLCGILSGLRNINRNIPVLGVIVGADPSRRIKRYSESYERLTLVKSSLGYDQYPKIRDIGGVELDKVYESKCLEFMMPKDLLWIVGKR